MRIILILFIIIVVITIIIIVNLTRVNVESYYRKNKKEVMGIYKKYQDFSDSLPYQYIAIHNQGKEIEVCIAIKKSQNLCLYFSKKNGKILSDVKSLANSYQNDKVAFNNISRITRVLQNDFFSDFIMLYLDGKYIGLYIDDDRFFLAVSNHTKKRKQLESKTGILITNKADEFKNKISFVKELDQNVLLYESGIP